MTYDDCNFISLKKIALIQHRVIAETFLDNPLWLPEVNHKNWIPWDNQVDNLECITVIGNIEHVKSNNLYPAWERNWQSKLTLAMIEDLRKLRQEWLSFSKLGVYANVSKTTVMNALKWLTYKW